MKKRILTLLFGLIVFTGMGPITVFADTDLTQDTVLIEETTLSEESVLSDEVVLEEISEEDISGTQEMVLEEYDSSELETIIVDHTTMDYILLQPYVYGKPDVVIEDPDKAELCLVNNVVQACSISGDDSWTGGEYIWGDEGRYMPTHSVRFWAIKPLGGGEVTTVTFMPKLERPENERYYYSNPETEAPKRNAKYIYNISYHLSSETYFENHYEGNVLEWCWRNNLMTATISESGIKRTLSMKAGGMLKRQDAATLLWKLAGAPIPKRISSRYFNDVSNSKAVAWIYESKISGGYSSSTKGRRFKPSSEITRGDFVLMLWKLAGKPIVNGQDPFDDINRETKYYQSLLWAEKYGIATAIINRKNKTPNMFHPNWHLRRGDAAGMLYRFYHATGIGKLPYTGMCLVEQPKEDILDKEFPSDIEKEIYINISSREVKDYTIYNDEEHLEADAKYKEYLIQDKPYTVQGAQPTITVEDETVASVVRCYIQDPYEDSSEKKLTYRILGLKPGTTKVIYISGDRSSRITYTVHVQFGDMSKVKYYVDYRTDAEYITVKDQSKTQSELYKAVYWEYEHNLIPKQDKLGWRESRASKYGITNPCSRKDFIIALWHLTGSPKPKKSATVYYKDVIDTPAIAWAYEQNHTRGYSNKTFKPNRKIKRSDVALMLWRMAGKPSISKKAYVKFNDVSKSSAYYKAVQWAAAQKIMSGYGDGTYKPGTTCTRGDIARILYRYNKKMKLIK